MRRDGSDAPFHPDTVATAQAVRGWRSEDGECCDVENFCLDLAGTPGTPWNKSARRVFIDDFLDVHVYACTDRKKIATMFNRHFRTVKKHYEEQRQNAEAAGRGQVIDRTATKQEKARQQRKYNVREEMFFAPKTLTYSW